MKMIGFNIVRITDNHGVPSDTRSKMMSWSKPAMYAKEQAAWHRGIWCGIFWGFVFSLVAQGFIFNLGCQWRDIPGIGWRIDIAQQQDGFRAAEADRLAEEQIKAEQEESEASDGK